MWSMERSVLGRGGGTQRLLPTIDRMDTKDLSTKICMSKLDGYHIRKNDGCLIFG